mmetsp:Transcript_5704/g.18340  ORF Transcript_5704/g.18340 Transcript_5704/m.18340 type:complete len:428 (+) Transcript_5704:85-1368(+)
MAPRHFIRADLAILGDGDVLQPGLVVLDGHRIAWVGSPSAGAEVPVPGEEDITTQTPVVMPGMWDVHMHFTGLTVLDTSMTMKISPAVACLRAVPDMRRVLDSGFTSVREPGYGHGLSLEQARQEGCIAGPRIYSAGAALSPTGGHADLHCYPIEFLGIQAAEHSEDSRVAVMCCCDGNQECLKAVRKNMRRGARLIKICASGGVLTEIDNPIHQQFSDEEMRTIVEEAQRNERLVAAHCHGKPGIMAALRAGVGTIEHGSFLDEEAADLMKEKGAMLVPTMLVVDRVSKAISTMPPHIQAKGRVVIDSHAEAVKIAKAKGIPFAVGTDSLTCGEKSPCRLGDSAKELELLMEKVGFTAMEAIVAATSAGPKCLGKQAPKSGLLKEGYDGDVITVSASPLEDIKVLQDPANITHIWQAGVLVKRPLC